MIEIIKSDWIYNVDSIKGCIVTVKTTSSDKTISKIKKISKILLNLSAISSIVVVAEAKFSIENAESSREYFDFQKASEVFG